MNEIMGEEQRVEQSVLAQESWVLALEGVVALIVGFIIFNGVLALIIGVLLLSLPFFEGLLTLAILIGLFRIIAGISLISLAFVAKSSQA